MEVAKVTSITMVDETQAVGSLRSRQGVMLRPEVAGRVSKILFNDGQRVKKGQLLVQFDDQLQAAQVAQAKAELSIAAANHKRNQELVAQNFISKRSLDESAAALEVAQAKLDLAVAAWQRLKLVAGQFLQRPCRRDHNLAIRTRQHRDVGHALRHHGRHLGGGERLPRGGLV